MWFLAQTAEPTLYVTTTDNTVVTTGGWAAFLGLYALTFLVVYVLVIIAWWRMFIKAGEAGWKSIIPFYNTYISFKIAGRNGWWFLALLVPFVNIFVSLMWAIDLAKHFGKSTVFGVLWLWLFSIVGYFMIGFGNSTYVGPKHQ